MRSSSPSAAYESARREQFARRANRQKPEEASGKSDGKTHTATTLNGDTVTAPGRQSSAGRTALDDSGSTPPVMREDKPGFGDWAGSNASAGLNQFNSGLFSTLDFVLPTELIFGEDKDPVSKLSQYYSNKLDRDTRRADQINTDMGGGWKTAGEITQTAVSAVPNAALSLMSGGASAGAQGTAALGTAASAAFAAAQNLVKNPMFWTSMARSTGPAYDRAKASGANELQATGAALLSGLGTSITEVGGGLEALPGKLGTSGGSTLSKWGISALQEGLEEPVQSSYENLVAKALYDHDRPWYSTTDPNAVFNPIRAGSEFALGTAVGGILGGVQTGISGTADPDSQIRDLKRQLEAVRYEKALAELKAEYDKHVPEKAMEQTAKSYVPFANNIRHDIITDKLSESGRYIPNAITAATTQNKIQSYVLNSNHLVGKEKARVFNSVLGYHYENWELLSNKIYETLQNSVVSKVETTEWGAKYTVPMRIIGEKGKSMELKTIWQIDNGSNIPRLITITFDKRTIKEEN